MATYIFFRKSGWYPVDGIKDDAEALVHIAYNPGTLKVRDALNERTVWDSDRDPMPAKPTH